ncbi:MAG: hypothetical protein FJ087_05930 [Deltaproteobacteria bacterium]|nr:hypothetical protein [Deltaproteobacteria bacterium]
MRSAAKLQADAWDAIVNALGMADALRYRILFQPGNGDYARERDSLFASRDIEDWIRAVRAEEAAGGGRAGRP